MSGINNITIGIVKPTAASNNGGNGSNGSNSSTTPIDFLELRLIGRGSQNGIANTGDLKQGDFVEGMKNAQTLWKSAMYNGGDPNDRNNYTPIVEVDLENYITLPEPTNPIIPVPIDPITPDPTDPTDPVIPVIPVPTTPDFSPTDFSPTDFKTT